MTMLLFNSIHLITKLAWLQQLCLLMILQVHSTDNMAAKLMHLSVPSQTMQEDVFNLVLTSKLALQVGNLTQTKYYSIHMYRNVPLRDWDLTDWHAQQLVGLFSQNCFAPRGGAGKTASAQVLLFSSAPKHTYKATV